MVLPQADTAPLLMMRFTSKASRDLVKCVKERLTEGGIKVVVTEGDDDKKTGKTSKNGSNCNVVIGLTTTQALLEHEAEVVKLVKPRRTHHKRIKVTMDHFSVKNREDFMNLTETSELSMFLPKNGTTEYDSEGIFTSSDRALLMDSILNELTVVDEDEVSSNLSRVLDKLKVPYLAVSPKKQSFEKDGKPAESSLSLCQVLQNNGLVDVICPVHIPHIQKKIVDNIFSMKKRLPIRVIRDYYGESIAFYFAWIKHLSLWLVFPGLLGLGTNIVRNFRGDTVDNCDITPFVGLGAFLWAMLCILLWEQEEARLSFEWGTYSMTDFDRRVFGKRPNFLGEMRISPVTGKLEKYYPSSKRMLKFLLSALVTIALLCGACVVIVVSMNLQGYVSREDQELWGDDKHPLYFPLFAQFAEEGNIFDSNTWKCFLPVILRALVVVNMNKQYQKVAEKLTEWENHETVVNHANSIVLKRFLFEAFDNYSILFYLAIYERDIQKLRGELVGAFNVDSFRRMLTECIIPLVMRRFTADKDKKKVGASKKKDSNSMIASENSLTLEADLDEYELFDDFIETLIQFGYVTLFASAYPLAAFIAIAANLVESRSDLWKISHLCRRPTPIRTDGIGMWGTILKVITWTSALTNCLIFTFTSSQMRQWIPENYVTDKHGRSVFAPGAGHENVLIMLGIEHGLLLIGALFRFAIPRVPEDVLIEVEKRLWLHEMMSQKSKKSFMKVLGQRMLKVGSKTFSTKKSITSPKKDEL